MAGKYYALIFLCTFLLKQATIAAVNPENQIDFSTFYNSINEKFHELYTLTVVASIDTLKETVKDMESLHDNNPDVIRRTAECTNFIKEVESLKMPLKLDKQHSLILKWEDLFVKYELPNVVNLLFTLSMEKHGFDKVIAGVGNKYRTLYDEFNTKLSELWHTLTEAQKADNVQFSEWYGKYEKLQENERNAKFKMWGELFTIVENNNNEL